VQRPDQTVADFERDASGAFTCTVTRQSFATGTALPGERSVNDGAVERSALCTTLFVLPIVTHSRES
jgi:hypothetical protein